MYLTGVWQGLTLAHLVGERALLHYCIFMTLMSLWMYYADTENNQHILEVLFTILLQLDHHSAPL